MNSRPVLSSSPLPLELSTKQRKKRGRRHIRGGKETAMYSKSSTSSCSNANTGKGERGGSQEKRGERRRRQCRLLGGLGGEDEEKPFYHRINRFLRLITLRVGRKKGGVLGRRGKGRMGSGECAHQFSPLSLSSGVADAEGREKFKRREGERETLPTPKNWLLIELYRARCLQKERGRSPQKRGKKRNPSLLAAHLLSGPAHKGGREGEKKEIKKKKGRREKKRRWPHPGIRASIITCFGYRRRRGKREGKDSIKRKRRGGEGEWEDGGLHDHIHFVFGAVRGDENERGGGLGREGKKSNRWKISYSLAP